jgi:hypothetical protein
MRKSDVICPGCHAGYRRIELISRPGESGEFRCLSCNHLLEVFDGSREVALRLTVQPSRIRKKAEARAAGETLAEIAKSYVVISRLS